MLVPQKSMDHLWLKSMRTSCSQESWGDLSYQFSAMIETIQWHLCRRYSLFYFSRQSGDLRWYAGWMIPHSLRAWSQNSPEETFFFSGSASFSRHYRSIHRVRSLSFWTAQDLSGKWTWESCPVLYTISSIVFYHTISFTFHSYPITKDWNLLVTWLFTDCFHFASAFRMW